jgi:hypothetical protein
MRLNRLADVSIEGLRVAGTGSDGIAKAEHLRNCDITSPF